MRVNKKYAEGKWPRYKQELSFVIKKDVQLNKACVASVPVRAKCCVACERRFCLRENWGESKKGKGGVGGWAALARQRLLRRLLHLTCCKLSDP